MPEQAEKQTKKILQGVWFHDHTYLPGEEDALESRLTQEGYARLMRQDVPPLTGDWSPKGQGEEPMQRSRAVIGNPRGNARGFGPSPSVMSRPDNARAEAEALRKENERLKAELESRDKAERQAAEASGRQPAQQPAQGGEGGQRRHGGGQTRQQ